MSRREKIIWAVGIGVPMIFFLSFSVYWFGYRDNWEIDNYYAIDEKCKAVELAIADSDDIRTNVAFQELLGFMGPHIIQESFINDRIERVKTAMHPVEARLQAIAAERELELQRQAAAAERAEQKRIAEETRKQEAEAKLDECRERRTDAGVFACRQLESDLRPAALKFSDDVSVVYLEKSDLYVVQGVVYYDNSFGARQREDFDRFIEFDELSESWSDITHSLSAEDELKYLQEVNDQLQAMLDKLHRNYPR